MQNDKLAVIQMLVIGLTKKFEDANKTGVLFDSNEMQRAEERLKDIQEILSQVIYE